jgi:16S rRNA (guanine527-N7)-methyltransferase
LADAAANCLDSGLAGLGITPTTRQREQLLAYVDLLQRWNRHFNLTAVRDRQSMVTRHLLDSLSLLPLLPEGAAADVGAGAGLPGIPLAILRSEQSFSLLDSNGKKTRFMFQAVAELGLENCAVVKSRVEEWQPPLRFAVIVSRAFASLADMVDTCAHLLAPQGLLLAMKGRLAEEELTAAGLRADILAVTALAVPGLDEERCAVALRPRPLERV